VPPSHPAALPGGTWTPMATDGAPRLGPPFVAVGAGRQMLVWGGTGCTTEGLCGQGGRYDSTSDSWAPMSDAGAPAPRFLHAAVWTGKLLLIWGGQGCGPTGCADGGAYDPATDQWTSVPSQGAPRSRGQHTAVWTGSEMLVWGGRTVPISTQSERLGQGGAYNPAQHQWSAMATDGEPSPRFSHSAVWTGKDLIVWGGDVGLNAAKKEGDGAIYDPARRQWRPMSMSGAPSARYQPATVWTGTEMLVWGGLSLTAGRPVELSDGGAYNPQADRWRTLSANPQVAGSIPAVWTDSFMVLWGGPTAQGHAYDPATDRWGDLGVAGAPRARTNHALIWTGQQLLAWGGLAGEAIVFDGGRLHF
jgi:hypothetical protein